MRTCRSCSAPHVLGVERAGLGGVAHALDDGAAVAEDDQLGARAPRSGPGTRWRSTSPTAAQAPGERRQVDARAPRRAEPAPRRGRTARPRAGRRRRQRSRSGPRCRPGTTARGRVRSITSKTPCQRSTVTMPGSSASVRPARSFSASAAWMPAITWTIGRDDAGGVAGRARAGRRHLLEHAAQAGRRPRAAPASARP